MLIFIDQQRTVRVLRAGTDSTGRPKRERLGAISKVDFETPSDLAKRLTVEERAQLEETVDIYKRGARLERKSAALNFPRQLREVLEYFQDGASEREKQLIAFSILEGIRAIRQTERAIYSLNS